MWHISNENVPASPIQKNIIVFFFNHRVRYIKPWVQYSEHLVQCGDHWFTYEHSCLGRKQFFWSLYVTMSLNIFPPGQNVRHFADDILLYRGPGGRFKKAHELLNLRALKISMLYKNHIFQCMGKIFCVEFQRYPLKFHTKYLTHTLKDVDFVHNWKFKSS